MMARYTLMLAWLIAALGITACVRSPNSEPPNPRPEVQIAQGALADVERLGFEDASVERGMEVVVGTQACIASSSCFSCYQCHGIRGEGSATANFPRLSNQSYIYLKQASREFASGHRVNATMQEVVRALTEQQLKDAAAYYSAVRAEISLTMRPRDEASAELVATGLRIATEGSTEPVVQACAECHGTAQSPPAAPIYPYLAGQHVGYMENQLRAFKSGTREDPTQIMNHIAAQLTDEQIRAVARYFASLPPPSASSRARD